MNKSFNADNITLDNTTCPSKFLPIFWAQSREENECMCRCKSDREHEIREAIRRLDFRKDNLKRELREMGCRE